MRRPAFVAATLITASAIGALCWEPVQAVSTATPTGSETLPPRADGIDYAALDTAIDPCTDFYHHACGGFIATHPASTEKPIIELAQSQFDANLQHSLNKLMLEPSSGKSELKRLQTFYGSCHTGTLKDGDTVRSWLARIDAAKPVRASSKLSGISQRPA